MTIRRSALTKQRLTAVDPQRFLRPEIVGDVDATSSRDRPPFSALRPDTSRGPCRSDSATRPHAELPNGVISPEPIGELEIGKRKHQHVRRSVVLVQEPHAVFRRVNFAIGGDAFQTGPATAKPPPPCSSSTKATLAAAIGPRRRKTVQVEPLDRLARRFRVARRLGKRAAIAQLDRTRSAGRAAQRSARATAGIRSQTREISSFEQMTDVSSQTPHTADKSPHVHRKSSPKCDPGRDFPCHALRPLAIL